MIEVKEAPIEEIVKINATITEFGKPYDKNYFEEKIEGKEHLMIIAYFENLPAGYIVGYNRYQEGSFYCWMAGVNPSFRKKGVLKEMMKFMDSWAKKKGYSRIIIKTRNNRREMLSYLIKYNFQLIEVIPKSNTKENRILFEKAL